MHEIQRKLLDYAKGSQLAGKTLREIGDAIGETHPQKIKHHIEQLITKGLIQRDADGSFIVVSSSLDARDSDLASVPIIGAANCGPATMIAEEDIEGYLRVSPRLIPATHRVFALRAVGNSMNQATIHNTPINDGDYVLVDSDDKKANNGDYVLSIIDGMANIKRLYKDEHQNQIVLTSESSQKVPPIVLDLAEADYYLGGTVLRVIKSPKAYA